MSDFRVSLAGEFDQAILDLERTELVVSFKPAVVDLANNRGGMIHVCTPPPRLSWWFAEWQRSRRRESGIGLNPGQGLPLTGAE